MTDEPKNNLLLIIRKNDEKPVYKFSKTDWEIFSFPYRINDITFGNGIITITDAHGYWIKDINGQPALLDVLIIDESILSSKVALPEGRDDAVIPLKEFLITLYDFICKGDTDSCLLSLNENTYPKIKLDAYGKVVLCGHFHKKFEDVKNVYVKLFSDVRDDAQDCYDELLKPKLSFFQCAFKKTGLFTIHAYSSVQAWDPTGHALFDKLSKADYKDAFTEALVDIFHYFEYKRLVHELILPFKRDVFVFQQESIHRMESEKHTVKPDDIAAKLKELHSQKEDLSCFDSDLFKILNDNTRPEDLLIGGKMDIKELNDALDNVIRKILSETYP